MKDRVREHARKILWARSHDCALCHKPIKRFEEATLDHMVPRSMGGRTRLLNLQLAHMRCNSRKGSAMTYFSTDLIKAFQIIPSRLDKNGEPKR